MLALLLCFCTISTFTSRFGERHSTLKTSRDRVLESVQLHLAEQQESVKHAQIGRQRVVERRLLHAVAMLFLAACGVAVWYSIYLITTYGVIVFSCPSSPARQWHTYLYMQV